MDNGMESMLDTYLYETNSLLDQLDGMLVANEKNGDFSTDDVNEIFRIMHTIKGSSAMMEFNSLSTIAHHIEDLFFYIRDKGIELLDSDQEKELFNLMFRSEDYLRSEVEKVENGAPLAKNIDSFAAEINDFLKRISGAAPKKPEPASAVSAVSSAPVKKAEDAIMAKPDGRQAVSCIHVFLEEGIGMENLRAFMIVTALKDCELDFWYSPEDMDSNSQTSSEIMEKGFFLYFDSVDMAVSAEEYLPSQNHIRSYERLDWQEEDMQDHTTVSENHAQQQPQQQQPQQQNVQTSNTSPAEKQTDVNTAQSKVHAPVKQNLISVNLMKLDSLVDIVGEIVITESMVTACPELQQLSRDSYDTFMKSARQLRMLTDDLQDIAMSLRMVPISGVFQKMNRIVRDMKQKLGKDVRLTIIGENTEVDKTIVDSIQDPIMHIVRNSMDHGIEDTEDERTAAGKNAQGEIILSASHTSNEVVISITDDGRGMDPAAILVKAKEKGLLTKPESEYSRREIMGLVMLPGFSTNQTVTEYSGRGVGMDVVRKNVESVGGTVSISSDFGVGTTVTLKIPLTLAIVDGMKVTVGSSIFTIPIANIRQSFRVKADQIIRDEYDNEMVKRMDQFYPIVRLHEFFGLDTEVTDVENGILLWVEASERSYCLFVDDLIGEQQVVVKPLPVYLNSFNLKNYGIIGCTILGDGNISVILDVLGLHAATIENI